MFFHLSLSKTEMEIIISFLTVQAQLEDKELSMIEMSRIANIDYVSVLGREKQWMVENRILIPTTTENNKFKISFDNIAYLLFNSSNLNVLYDFAFQYIAFGPPKNLE